MRSAAPGVFGCPDRGCGLEMGIGSRTGYIRIHISTKFAKIANMISERRHDNKNMPWAILCIARVKEHESGIRQSRMLGLRPMT